MSKIHSESKSQLLVIICSDPTNCVSLCQRYILKANHNTAWAKVFSCVLCLTMSKIHSESKSQRIGNKQIFYGHCVSLCQRYILKANHNSFEAAIEEIKTVSHYVKDTFWKQITTQQSGWIPAEYCVSLCQRYILKANHNLIEKLKLNCCTVSHYVKDTFWKQITTCYR